jgi:small-conductance mechanosensitive channel
MSHFRIETKRVEPASAPEGGSRRHPLHRGRFTTGIVCGLGAFVALGLSTTFGNVHGFSIHEKVVALVGAVVFFVLAVIAVQSVARATASLVSERAGKAGGTAVRVIASFIGYVIVLFVGLGLLDVPVSHLLLGGALTGVIVGIAAQQALGNVFAGLVLLIARPFTVDEKVRVRSGALGGIFEGVVRSMNLAYVTIETEDGPINIPNSTMLAAGVGPAPAGANTDLAIARTGAPPVPSPETNDHWRSFGKLRAARSAIAARNQREENGP